MLCIMRMKILALCLVDTTLAKTFHPNCTMPDESGDYVAGVNIRSTASIFWSMMYTIFVCTWAVQHLNVPAQEPYEERKSGWRKIVTWIRATFWTKLKWMLATILLPELLVGRAFGDWVSVRRFKKKITNEKWTLIHGYYANMGGFVLQLPSTVATGEQGSGLTRDNEQSADGDAESSPDTAQTRTATGRKAVAVNTGQLRFLLDGDYIHPEPPLSEAEIQDKSKGDTFAIISAIFQLLWLVAQLITRRILKLHSTLLEIVALSFSVCAFFVYVLWFKKPQNIQIPTSIHLKCKCSASQRTKCERSRDQGVDCVSVDFIEVEAWLKSRIVETSFTAALFPLREKEIPELSPTIRNDQYNPNRTLGMTNHVRLGHCPEDFGFVIGAVILGVCHCAAWNFEFPTPIQRTLWRVTAVSITSIMPMYYLGWFALDRWSFSSYQTQLAIWTWVVYTVYAVLRLYLLVTAFCELGFLPPEAFVATWSVSFPHFG